MKFASTKSNTDSKAVAYATQQNAQLNNQARIDQIARCAYYKAEERGFVSGHELDDWLTAETELGMSGEKL